MVVQKVNISQQYWERDGEINNEYPPYHDSKELIGVEDETPTCASCNAELTVDELVAP